MGSSTAPCASASALDFTSFGKLDVAAASGAASAPADNTSIVGRERDLHAVPSTRRGIESDLTVTRWVSIASGDDGSNFVASDLG